MSYCPNCGTNLPEGCNFCPSCGTPLSGGKAPTYEVDSPNGLLAFVGFVCPLAGLIMFLYWHDKMPLKARSAGKGALAGVILEAVCSLIVFLLPLIFGASEITEYIANTINNTIF